jgi:hypothetical protein
MTTTNNRTSQDINLDKTVNTDILGADVTKKRKTFFNKSSKKKYDNF